jgi:hypothetical protein
VSMDLELADWRADWRADNTSDNALLCIDLRRLVDRKTRRMRLAFAGHLLFAVAMLVFTAWFASRRPTIEWILWATVLWAATFFGVGFTIWNQAGTWKALQQSNAAFLDLSRRRCRLELRAIWFGRWFLAANLIVVMVWLSTDTLLHRLPVSHYLFGTAVAILLGATWLAVFTARERRILHELEQLNQPE